VLQGGRAEYKVLEKKTKSTSAGVQEVTRNTQTIDAKRKAQHMGGVVAQKATEPAELKTYSSSAYADYSKAWDLLDKKWDAATEVYEAKMLQLGGTKQPNGNWSYFVNDKTNAVIQERDTVQSFVKQEKSKLTQAKAARESAGSYQPYWDKISKNLDAQLLEASVAKQKRPFSGIVALKSLNRETCAGGTTAFADKLLVDTDFKVGVCALVSAGLKIGIGESGGKISGHAIAVHYAKSNLLRIFDPNIGVFTCTSKGRLKAALVAMIDVGWVKVFGWQLDDQFGYALFEARPSAVDLPSQQQAVHYTASAETTAIQNKTVIPSSTQAPMVAPSKPAVVIKKPVAPTAGTGPVGAKLSDRLDQVLKNGQKIAKVGGREAPTYEGTGAGYDQWVKLDKQLVDGIISAKVAQGNAGLKGNNTLGEPIARGALAQIIGFLQARGL
jgi:hypothetical protein